MARRNILLTVLMAHTLSAFAQGNLAVEAETGSVTPPFVVTNGCLVQVLATNLIDGGRAAYDVTISQPGDYVIFGLVSSPEHASSLGVNIDAETKSPQMLWDIPISQEFTNRTVTWRDAGAATSAGTRRKVFSLSAGPHLIIFQAGDVAGARLDRFVLARIPSPPGNLRVVVTP